MHLPPRRLPGENTMIDPFEMWQQLTRAFHSYCSETFPIHASQPELRELYAQAIRRENAITRQPLVSMIPAYGASLTPQQLFGNGAPPRLHANLRRMNAKEFDHGRRLYKHQVEATTRIQNGHNTVIATGTGSGKTEAFLLPILDHCARSREKGVQAILVYP